MTVFSKKVLTNLFRHLQRLPVVLDIRRDRLRNVVEPLPVARNQIVQRQVDEIRPADLQPAHKLVPVVADRADEEVEPIAQEYRILQTANAPPVEPLLTPAALYHLSQPIAIVAAVAVVTFLVCPVQRVPGERINLEGIACKRGISNVSNKRQSLTLYDS